MRMKCIFHNIEAADADHVYALSFKKQYFIII